MSVLESSTYEERSRREVSRRPEPAPDGDSPGASARARRPAPTLRALDLMDVLAAVCQLCAGIMSAVVGVVFLALSAGRDAPVDPAVLVASGVFLCFLGLASVVCAFGD